MRLDDLLYRHPKVRKLVSQLVPDREITVSLLQRKFRVSTRLEVGMVRLAWLVNTSPTGRELASLFSLTGLLQPGDVFVDVGANVGLYSVPLASIGDVAGFRCVAVEPNPRTARLLRQNLAPYPCATVVEAAASDSSGELPMVYSSLASVTFRAVESSNDGRFLRADDAIFRIRCLRCDELPELATGRLVFKIDVEGHETEVIGGMENLFAAHRVAAVMIDGYNDPAIPARLEAYGFTLYDGCSLRPYDPGRHVNLLAVHDDRR